MKSQKTTRKVELIAILCTVFALAMLVLHHNIGNAWRTSEYLPELTDNPVYVEFSENLPLEVTITPQESFQLKGIEVVLVNISSDSRGTLVVTMTDSEGNTISTLRKPLSELSVGSWNELDLGGYLTEGEQVTFTFAVDTGNPYFMSLPKEAGSQLPYSLRVEGHGDAYISLGLQRVDITSQTFGDIFYYSIPICIVLFILAFIWIILGRNFSDAIKKIPVRSFLEKAGNEIFLLIVFITLTVSIYSRGYLQSVYITADSAGYLREAKALASGYGFSYDGIAGYNTWFAMWPIVYPALIAGVMLLTGMEAYAASKLLSVILVMAILIVLYLFAKKDAWIYALALLNTGFVSLTWYTWSELPFMLLLTCFGITLGKIVSTDRPQKKLYILLGVFGLLTFLTRYYGLFVFFVIGAYILYFFVKWLGEISTETKKNLQSKWINLTLTAGISGVMCLLYLFNNKLQNGLASGVARTMWWDDYRILTDDLITSLLTEFFHVIHIETPDLISALPVRMQVWILFMLLIGLMALIIKPLRRMGEHSVWILMSLIYYVMFICIRYVSSMDTFYFRFFEPGTYVLSIGIIGYLISEYKNKSLRLGGIVVALVMMIVTLSTITEGALTQESYCHELERTWDEAYADIPEKSVVIFSTLDFRSSWYRPDVVEGSIDPSMTMEDIKNTYYGSDNMCISVSDAETMIAEPVYPEDVDIAIREGLAAAGDSEYICIKLK